MKNYIKTISSFFIKLLEKFRSIRLLYQIIITITILAAIIASKFFSGYGYVPQAKVVEIQKVTKGDILKTTRLLGTIEAKKLFSAQAGYEGTVSYVSPAGSTLKAGEIIARIQNDPMEEAYHAATKSVQIAGEQYNRQLVLFNSKAASRQTVEDKFTALSTSRSALVSAKMNYDKIVFVAPFDGTVGSAMIQVGSMAKLGDAIVTFYDSSEFAVKFDIPSDYAKILVGDSYARINDKDYKIDFIQKALSIGTYTIPAHINFPCENCLSGELIDVDLHIINKQNIIVVPKSCIFIRDNNHFVYKVKNGKTELEQVTLGIVEKDQIEVTEGLVEGETIILKGQNRLYPGDDVKVFEGGSTKE